MLLKVLFIFCATLYFAHSNELLMSTPEVLQQRNIPYEEHNVTTEDGYILTIFRLLKESKKGVVLLQHSLSLDSTVFLVSRKRCIAMELYNDGYEVWMPNFRGLPYSDKHINPNINNRQYWDFSFHEIGYYDIHAIIGHIYNTTNSKMIVINHSLSSTASLVYSSLRPKEAKDRVKVFINSAASAFMSHTKTPLKNFIGLQMNIVAPIMQMFNVGADNMESTKKVSKELVLSMIPPDLLHTILEKGIEWMFGKSGGGLDPEEVPMMISIGLKTVAQKILNHYSQMIVSGRFRMFDYGVEENLKRYNQTNPPNYPLEKIKVPTLLVISDSDTVSDAWGSNTLYEHLPENAKIYGKMNVHLVNHADYLVGKNRFEYFGRVMKFINSLK